MPDQRIVDLNAAIARSRGGIATLWDYGASLSELSIRITWLGTSENIHLVCNGCIRVEATMTWSNVDLECHRSEVGEFGLVDQKSRFLLLCGQIRVLQNVEPMFVAR